jgi:SET domain-containing protein
VILVPHYVGASAIQGVGLFCAQALQPGQVVYRYDYRFVQVISQVEIDALPPPMRESVLKYSYRGRGAQRLSGAYWFCVDDGRYMNHSVTPNCVWSDAADAYLAAAELPADTELTCDYRDFCEPGDLDFEP